MSAPSLSDQPWLKAQPTQAVMAALQAAGGQDCARFVGGCVRNALTGHPIDDVDIATRLHPDQVIAAIEAAGLKAVPTGVAHGTVTAVSSGEPFEITTLRRDVETDGRRAVVAFTDDWGEDAQRRDFRLNAIYVDADGVVFDPTGQGVADALAGRIVFVGDADVRIAEDALWILRFFRFRAWYGRGAPDAEALAACGRMRARIDGLSAERISKELLKLLAAPDPAPTVRAMAETGVLAQTLPEAGGGLSAFERLVTNEQKLGQTPDPLLRLAALMVGAADLAGWAQRLRLANAQRDRLVAALQAQGLVSAAIGPSEARQLIYRLGATAFRDGVQLAWAVSGDEALWREQLAEVEHWRAPRFPLSGDDAIALGMISGPQVGQALRAVEAWWVAQDFAADRAQLVAQLSALADGVRSP